MFFANSDNAARRNSFSIFDGHALYLIRVPHGISFESNGEVIAECAPKVCDDYLDFLFTRALQNRDIAEFRQETNRRGE